jgi:glycosyltransferase involved in cell wall biosynthesis
MKDLAVSIIVPVFKKDKAFKKCIKSLLKLNYRNYEIIIVDHGPKGNILNLLKNIKLIKLKLVKIKNPSPSAARNIGMKNSSTNLLIFIDSDCIVSKNIIKKIIDKFMDDKDLDSVSGAKKTYNRESNLAKYIGYRLDSSYNTIKKKKLIFTGTHLCACKRYVFKKVTFDERYKFPSGEDIKFSCDVARYFKVRFYNDLKIMHRNASRISTFFKKYFYRYYAYFVINEEEILKRKINKIEKILFPFFLFYISTFMILEGLTAYRILPEVKRHKESMYFLVEIPFFVFLEKTACLCASIVYFFDFFMNKIRIFN